MYGVHDVMSATDWFTALDLHNVDGIIHVSKHYLLERQILLWQKVECMNYISIYINVINFT